MNTDGKLRDKACGNAGASARFICERPLGAPPLCGDGWEHSGQSCYKVRIVTKIFFICDLEVSYRNTMMKRRQNGPLPGQNVWSRMQTWSL